MADKKASRIDYFGKVLIDLTGDDIAPENLDEGIKAHDKTGSPIVGTRPIPENLDTEIAEQKQLIAEIKLELRNKAAGDGEVIEPDLQEKTVTPTTSEQEVTPDPAYDGLSKVIVEAIQVQEKSVNPSTEAQEVTPDSGKYLSKVNVGAVPTAEQATPSITVDENGLIEAEVVQGAGYVDSGTKSATKQLSTQAAKTVTPTKSEQTVVDKGKFTTGDIKVGAIPDEYIIPSGTKEITQNGTHDVTQYESVNVNVPSEDLGSVLDAQEMKLNQLLNVLDGKAAGGGGAVQTCTVTIYHDNDTDGYIIYTTPSGSVIQPYLDYADIVLSNVLCKSAIAFFGEVGYIDYRNAIIQDGISILTNFIEVTNGYGGAVILDAEAGADLHLFFD